MTKIKQEALIADLKRAINDGYFTKEEIIDFLSKSKNSKGWKTESIIFYPLKKWIDKGNGHWGAHNASAVDKNVIKKYKTTQKPYEVILKIKKYSRCYLPIINTLTGQASIFEWTVHIEIKSKSRLPKINGILEYEIAITREKAEEIVRDWRISNILKNKPKRSTTN